MKLIRTEYEVENNHPVVYIFTHDESNNQLIIKDPSFIPYFYVPASEILTTSTPHKSIYGEDVIKLHTSIPSDVPKLRGEYSKHYEADILFPLRYLIDKVDTIEKCNLRVMYVDIETVNLGRIPDPFIATEPIICLTAYQSGIYTTFIWHRHFNLTTNCKTFFDSLHIVHCFHTEKEMLRAFTDYINNEKPDILTGWNCNGFDFPYIMHRMRKLGLEPNILSPMNKAYVIKPSSTMFNADPKIIIKGISVIDLMGAYKIITGWTEGLKESYSLDAIGHEVLGYGKIGDANNINWQWDYDPYSLINYNTQDVRICVEIDKKQQIMSFIDEIRRICFCQFEDALTISRMADTYILKLFHNRKVFPSRNHDQDTPEYEGALVECEGGGLYENVAIYDIASLYPNIISTFNLSPETMRNEYEHGAIRLGKYYVQQNIKGYLPETIDHLKKERAIYKDLRSQAEYGSNEYIIYNARQEVFKRLLNGIYGQTAFPGSRLYDPRIAETITWMGRELIKWSKCFIEKKGYKVIYIDTDSLHVKFDTFDIAHMNQVLELINNSYDQFVSIFGLGSHSFAMEFEKVYDRVFYGKDVKKRYAGHICWKGDKAADILNIYGFETKRSDSSRLTRKVMTEVFDMVLRQRKNEDDVIEYINSEINKLRSGMFNIMDIGVPKGLTKSPYNYFRYERDVNKYSWEQKGLTANIRGIIYGIEVMGIQYSFKPKMVYVKSLPDGYPSIDVLCFDDVRHIPPGTVIDVETMIEKIIVKKMGNIFAGLGWDVKKLNWEKPKKERKPSAPRKKKEKIG